jgi:hypothetical protein
VDPETQQLLLRGHRLLKVAASDGALQQHEPVDGHFRSWR